LICAGIGILLGILLAWIIEKRIDAKFPLVKNKYNLFDMEDKD